MNYYDLHFITQNGECTITVPDAYDGCTSEDVKDAMDAIIASGVYGTKGGPLVTADSAELRVVSTTNLTI